MAQDEDFREQFHQFGRRLADGSIRYPSGARINVSRVPFTQTGFGSEKHPLDPSSRPSRSLADWPLLNSLSAWVVQPWDAFFRGGQTINVTLAFSSIPHKNNHLGWSYRLAGTGAPSSPVAKGGEWQTIKVPGTADSSIHYEFTPTAAISNATYEMRGILMNITLI